MTVYRTPEDVAPEIGIPVTTLKRLCKQTGINHRVERNRITLTEADIKQMIAYIDKHGTRPAQEPGKSDPFATR